MWSGERQQKLKRRVMHTWAVRGWAIDRGRLVFQVVCICVGLNM